MVTLFHWDLPQQLQDEYGGFNSSRIADDFAYYSDVVFRELGALVRSWVTFNEPLVVCDLGFKAGACGRRPPHATWLVGGTHWWWPGSSLLLLFSPGPLSHPLKAEISAPGGRFCLCFCCFCMFCFCFCLCHLCAVCLNHSTTPARGPSSGTFPPGWQDGVAGSFRCGHNILLAHAAAVKVYRERYQASQAGKLSIAAPGWFAMPADPDSQAGGGRCCLMHVLMSMPPPLCVRFHPSHSHTLCHIHSVTCTLSHTLCHTLPAHIHTRCHTRTHTCRP